MSKTHSIAGDGKSNYPSTTWGTGEGVGAQSNSTGREHTLDPRKRCALLVGGNIKPKKRPKARSSITPW